MSRTLVALAALLALLAAAFEAGAACTAGNPNALIAESTPTSAFTDHGDGTLTHNLTGLMWKRCAQGLSGAGCATGIAATMTWSEALAAAVADTTAGHSDWRLPNKKELESIVETCGFSPAINQTLFPATPTATSFWSGSSYDSDPTTAWDIIFSDGSNFNDDKSSTYYARLVRAGRPFDAFDAQNPTTVTASLDVDASNTATKYDALTDGLLIFRYLSGLTGTSLTASALGSTATRTDPNEVRAYLDGILSSLDIDSNGTTGAATDGLLVIRYLFGLRGAALIQGAVGAGAQRTSATDIETYIQSLMP